MRSRDFAKPVVGPDALEASKEFEMRGKAHRHVALVAAENEAEASHTHAVAAPRPLANGISLLGLSVPARLTIVGAIAALLWALVWLWALP